MTKTRQQLGAHGEQLAVNYLQMNGFTILETNWRCEHGEIDIVARDHDTLVFVEVRTRRAASTEMAFESINQRKQTRLINLAYAYLAANEQNNAAWRIDVIAIALSGAQPPIIDHVEDAVGW